MRRFAHECSELRERGFDYAIVSQTFYDYDDRFGLLCHLKTGSF